jgi:anti-anti-sigma factor
MSFTVSQEQGRVPVTILHLAGRINLSNAEELERQGREEYNRGARNLLLDLSQVESITSAGLRAVLVLAKLFDGESASKSTHVKLLRPSTPVRQVITIAGLDTLMDILTDPPSAIHSF